MAARWKLDRRGWPPFIAVSLAKPGLQGESLVGLQLPPGAETIWSLNQGLPAVPIEPAPLTESAAAWQ